MAVMKLSTAASFCGKPYKWARTVTSTTTSTAATFIATQHSSSLSLSITTTSSLNSNTTNWRTITPYAHLSYNSNNINANLLGFSFRGHKRFSIFSNNSTSASSSSSSSSSSKFSGSDSSSAGSGLVADMGSESKIDTVDNNNINNNSHLNGQNHKQQQDSYSKLLTLPTILTLGRVAAVPLLVSTFYVDSWWGRTATTSIFIAAAVTDWLDGYLARKMRLGSAFGAFLDPVADKLMVAATLILLCTKPPEVAIFGQVPWLLTVPSIAIIGREITMSAVREWAASQNAKLLEAVAVNNLGKWKTATQMIALTILLATRESTLGGPGVLVASGVVLLYISAGLSVWSLVVYMSKIWRVLLK
ncbi:CDP-diacylglycerol--glycerol-3-phosphate 3-phosphatidyltransferase 2 [Ricinus communis]|uniref:CDP-diacylglycerol--glycerol-3-phosphate 1-phosphatidyltransferase n=1 Tax=Ricinus communis TaxID=3988 RepID=B9SGD6_RICCO|nr:CDP-diacylglycerol--glycerol-3-phosphate 3-phosphatidyltransferase 2 [Ricinus communis]EEF37302.1 cdp-diacylglycerol--glycerol-3-phosphate 3-phosphatidyltransferase, putative [Ricinus communis]|eukprot:XP_002525055.1 CDP-diacylglycerol--glycerol-3-phosphate 3-phosphatidyltransferase 2 [Ricinus communis]